MTRLAWFAVPVAVVSLCNLLVSVPAASGLRQQPTFAARVEAVRVDVLVTDGSRAVRNLGRDDFEVLDNGVPQQVDLASFEQLPLNVVLAFDVSSSVAGQRMENLKRAEGAVVRALGKEDRVSLVVFSRRLSLFTGAQGEAGRVQTALEGIVPDGETALVDGCFAGLVLAEAGAGRALLIVFSDGVDTASWLPADRVLEAAKRAEAVTYSVSAGRPGRMRFLERLSEATGGSMFEVESARDLERAFVGIIEEFRQRYLLSYSPRGVQKGGWHRLEVRVKGRRYAVKARPGYEAGR